MWSAGLTLETSTRFMRLCTTAILSSVSPSSIGARAGGRPEGWTATVGEGVVDDDEGVAMAG